MDETQRSKHGQCCKKPKKCMSDNCYYFSTYQLYNNQSWWSAIKKVTWKYLGEQKKYNQLIEPAILKSLKCGVMQINLGGGMH